jgi:hypothetical protein
MGITNEFVFVPVHAHTLLLGWVSMFLYGFFYKLYPQTEGKLRNLHFAVANAGLLLMIGGLSTFLLGNQAIGEPITIIAALTVFLGTALFAFIVFRATK